MDGFLSLSRDSQRLLLLGGLAGPASDIDSAGRVITVLASLSNHRHNPISLEEVRNLAAGESVCKVTSKLLVHDINIILRKLTQWCPWQSA